MIRAVLFLINIKKSMLKVSIYVFKELTGRDDGEIAAQHTAKLIPLFVGPQLRSSSFDHAMSLSSHVQKQRRCNRLFIL